MWAALKGDLWHPSLHKKALLSLHKKARTSSHVEMATEQEVLCRAIDEELAAFLRCIDNYETASREVSRACKPASALCCDAGSAPTESASPWGSLGA